MFNGMYPQEVAGLVLVDATQEDQYRLLPRASAATGLQMRRRAERQAFWAPFYIGLGIARLQFTVEGRDVPPAVILQAKYLKARANEFQNIEVSAEQARRADRIDEKAASVLTAGRVIDDSLKAMLSEQDQRATRRLGSMSCSSVWHACQRRVSALWSPTAVTTCREIART